MKKKYVIISIIVIILIIAISLLVYQKIVEEGKNYEIEKITDYKYFVLKQGEKYGVIDKAGNTIIETKYDEVKIPNPQEAIFVCKENGKNKVFNANKEEILTKYEDIEPIRLKNLQSDLMYEKTVLKYKKDGKYGLVGIDGKEITGPIYDEIDNLAYKEGELLVKQNNKYGVINIKGNNLVEIKYDSISVDKYYTDENLYKNSGYIVSETTNEGYRYGYINTRGNMILKTEYNELNRVNDIQDDNNVYLISAKNGLYGVNKNEENIIPNEYQSITYDKSNNIFVVEKNKKYGVADINGSEIIPVQYNQISITGMYIYAENDQGTTVYTSTGEQAQINQNIAIVKTSNDNYRIKINTENGTKYGIVDKNDKQIVEEKYNYIEYLFNNYFIVSEDNGKLGVIDDKENKLIEAKYDSIQKIYNKNIIQATISSEKLTELYSKDIKQICQMTNAVVKTEAEYIKIYDDTQTKYFNNEGKELKNTDVYPENTLFAKMENGKWGFVDKNGNTKVDFQYDKATEFNEYGFAAIKKDEKWGAINEKGEIVVEPIYELNTTEDPSFIGKYYKVTYGFGEVYYSDNK